MDAKIHLTTVTGGPVMTRCYILRKDGEEGCVLIDPGPESRKILEACAGDAVKAILLTHGHFDHIASVDAVCGADTQLMIHEADAELTGSSMLNASAGMMGVDIVCRNADRLLRDGDEVTVCGMSFRVIHTPGHTKGSVCYELENQLFTGDTVFFGGFGRTDLPGGSMAEMRQSLRKLRPLLEDHVIHPGH